MSECENCHIDKLDARNGFYKDAITALKESQLGSKLPEELFNKIIDLVYPMEVTVHWVYKSRCGNCKACCYDEDEDEDEDTDENEDEDTDDDWRCDGCGYIYHDAQADLCAQCFLQGIKRVWNSNSELPYMRYHSGAFFNKIPIEVDPYEYQLPRNYNVTYYRRKQPVRHKGMLCITRE